jgi:hypothetical protein
MAWLGHLEPPLRVEVTGDTELVDFWLEGVAFG